MESRLMLSATSLNVTDAQPFAISFLGEYQTLAASRTSLVPATHEGGYIGADVGASIGRTNWHLLNSGQNLDSSVIRGDFFLNLDSLLSGNSQLDGMTSAWTADYDGIQPAVIVFSEDDGGHGTATASLFTTGAGYTIIQRHGVSSAVIDSGGLITIGAAERSQHPVEGGPISISTLLTNLRKENTLARSEKAHSSRAVEQSIAIKGSSDRIVVSELARATVFATMGGDSDSSESSSLKAQRTDPSASLQTLDVSQPLSSINQLDNGPVQLQEASHLHQEDAPVDAGPRRFGQSQSRAASSSDSAFLRASIASLIHSWFTPPSKAAGEGSENADTLAIDAAGNELAVAAAFDKLGQGETAVVEFTSDGELIGRLANASPLLLILALERISALQGRLAQRQGTPHLRPKSKRSTSA